jgi:pyruvate/2-oxoglutarate dehydrogenase complex dihydrolipoamide dehydrogenase (E3) component
MLGCHDAQRNSKRFPDMTPAGTSPDGNGFGPAFEDADESLDRLVRPRGWQNPQPRGLYDLVVIGGGTAGLVSAVGAAGLGARVALVERQRLGGDCLNTGCVPSKAILRTARAVGEIRRAPDFGIHVGRFDVDFGAVMLRMRQRRAQLAPNDSAARVTQLGIDLFFGTGSFRSPRELALGSTSLRFRRAVIATGSRPAIPPVDGLADTPHLTNETVFGLTERPARLLTIGAGPIGCELSQAFARLGTQVVLFDQSPRILPNDDPDGSALVQRALIDDGVQLELTVEIRRVSRRGDALVVSFKRSPDHPEEEIEGDRLLVATGRTPDVSGLDVERAGIQAGTGGIVVDDRLRTSNHRVYAAGDVCSRFQFTHAADAMARIVIQNALFFGRRKASALTIPWCTFTDPQVAHVGLSPDSAHRPAEHVQTITVPLAEVDRGVLDDETGGFLRLHHRRGRVVGCTIVSSQAGDLIGLAGNLISRRASVAELSSTIFPYPTQAEAYRKAGDAYRRTRLTPRVRRAFERYFALARW